MRDDLAHVIRAVEQGEKEIRLKGYITKLLVKLTDLIYAHQVLNVKMKEMSFDKEQLRIIVTERDTLQGLIDPLPPRSATFSHERCHLFRVKSLVTFTFCSST